MPSLLLALGEANGTHCETFGVASTSWRGPNYAHPHSFG